MSALNGLKLVAAKPTHKANPAVQRRHKVIAQLSEQIALAEANQRGETYVSTRTVVVRDKAAGTSQPEFVTYFDKSLIRLKAPMIYKTTNRVRVDDRCC
jgi:hypothetical protein